MSSSIVQSSDVLPTIFREYIGAKSYPTFEDFPDIINPLVKEFHFILAFATERYDESETTKIGTGNFNLIPSLFAFNARIIKNLKTNHKNAKVVISIGGRGSQYPFNITNHNEKEIWLGNAERSLRNIIDRFKDSHGDFLIDGIDINYENINSKENDFADSIGKLIGRLREDGYVKVVSIAPSESVRRHYRTLFQIYGQDINWVGYQFYDQRLPNQDAFLNLYHDLLRDYPNEKLLAGFSTDPSDLGNISLEDFLAGCRRLLKDKLLPGIFIWNANDSAVQAIPYHAEKVLQELLVEFNQTAV